MLYETLNMFVHTKISAIDPTFFLDYIYIFCSQFTWKNEHEDGHACFNNVISLGQFIVLEVQ